jgi:hypothetical protein
MLSLLSVLFFFFFLVVELRIEPKVLHILGQHVATELYCHQLFTQQMLTEIGI